LAPLRSSSVFSQVPLACSPSSVLSGSVNRYSREFESVQPGRLSGSACYAELGITGLMRSAPLCRVFELAVDKTALQRLEHSA
jgi:hypothetical protein